MVVESIRERGDGDQYGLTGYQVVRESFGFGTFNNGQVVGSSVNARKGILTGSSLKTSRRKFQIMDGLSNTIMLVEMAGAMDYYIQGRTNELGNLQLPVWCSDKTGCDIRGTDPNRRLSTDEEDQSNLTCGMNCENQGVPYSFHSGGCNFLFADGSVHFLNQSIDMGLLAALGTYQGGEPAGLGNY